MAKRYLQEHKSDVHMTDEEFEAIKDARRNQVHASKDVSSHADELLERSSGSASKTEKQARKEKKKEEQLAAKAAKKKASEEKKLQKQNKKKKGYPAQSVIGDEECAVSLLSEVPKKRQTDPATTETSSTAQWVGQSRKNPESYLDVVPTDTHAGSNGKHTSGGLYTTGGRPRLRSEDFYAGKAPVSETSMILDKDIEGSGSKSCCPCCTIM